MKAEKSCLHLLIIFIFCSLTVYSCNLTSDVNVIHLLLKLIQLLWSQEDAAVEIAEKISQFVLSLPKSVRKVEQESIPEHIQKMLDEAKSSGHDHHHHQSPDHGHGHDHYGDAHIHGANYMDAYGLGHGHHGWWKWSLDFTGQHSRLQIVSLLHISHTLY